MITGETRIIVFDLPEVDIDSVEKVNIYLANGSKTIVKTYPGEVTYSEGRFALPLLQEDTLNLGIGVVKSQAEIIFNDKAVAKTNVAKINMNDALGTELVFENKPNPNQLSDFTFRIEGNVIIASVNSDLTYTKEEVNQIAEDLQQSISGIIDDSKVNSATNTLSAEKISQINSKTVKDLEQKIADVINDAAEDSENTTLSAKKITQIKAGIVTDLEQKIADVIDDSDEESEDTTLSAKKIREVNESLISSTIEELKNNMKTVEVSAVDTVTLKPNILYVLDGTVEDLTIVFEDGLDNSINEFMWQFEGHDGVMLSLPDDVIYEDDMEFEEGKIYQFSCVNNLLFFAGL